MSDPDAITALIWLGLFMAILCAFAAFAQRKTRKRPRDFLRAPDPRCVVGKDWKAHVQTHRF